MKYLKSFNESLSSIVYHFTSTNNVMNILKDNKINLTSNIGTDADQKINKNKLYSLSTTTSRSSDVGYAAAQSKNNMARLTLDGSKINHSFKSIRVDYWQKPKDPKDPLYNPHGDEQGKEFLKYISRQDELEDRIISDKDIIPNANKYITSVETLNATEEDNATIKYYCDELNIPFYAYDDAKYFDSSTKKKALDIIPIRGDIKSRGVDFFNDDVKLLAYIIFNNKMKEKIFNELNKFDGSDKLKEDAEKYVDKNIDEFLSYPNDFWARDLSSSLASTVHNNKRSNNPLVRYLIRELGLDMKRNNTPTIYDYLKHKPWVGKKTQKELNKTLNTEVLNKLKEVYKEKMKDQLNFSYYDTNGDYQNKVYDDEMVKKSMDNIIKEIANYYSSFILNNDDLFKYSYQILNSHVKDKLNLRDKETYASALENLDDKDLYYSMESVISFTLSDMDDFIEAAINKLQEQYREQWN